jgi:Right handed beta helix region/FlgD Ig-like domain
MKYAAVLTAIVLASFSSFATATTINVPADYATIQEAISVAVAGDEVVIAVGVYSEYDITLKSGVTVRGESGNAADVVIDGAQNGRVLSGFEIDTNAIIRDLTVTGGYAVGESFDRYGGGLFLRDSSPQIMNCVFTGNYADLGGALYFTNSNPSIDDCEFFSNTGSSGGAGFFHQSSPSISNSSFHDNEAFDADGGCFFISSNCSPQFNYCLFYNNHARWWGGVMISQVDCNSSFENCTLVHNSTDISWGSAIVSIANSTPKMKNCIVAYNSGDGALNGHDEVSLPEVICCDVFGNSGGDYGGYLEDQTGINGNISLNPIFCDADANNYTLDPQSPCMPEYNECAVLMGALVDGCVSAVDDFAEPSNMDLTVSPNPFSRGTEIRFAVPAGTNAEVTIYDISGRYVRNLMAGEIAGGQQLVRWDGLDESGTIVSPGIYYCRLTAGTELAVTKLLLMK